MQHMRQIKISADDLKQLEFLRAIPEDELEAWAQVALAVRTPRRTNLITAGEEARALYLIRGGIVLLCLETRDGETRMSGLAGPGQCFGLEVLHPTARATHFVCALTEVEAIAIAEKEVRAAIERGGLLARLLAGFTAARYAELTDDYVRSTTLDVRARAAVAMLRVSDALGSSILPLTQEQVASLVGTRRETLALVLSRMRADGLIATRYRAIEILDRTGLREAARDGYPTCMDLGLEYPITGRSSV